MNVLVVLGHPEGESLNHAIANTAVEALKRNGHEVTFHDLYAEKFDPVMPTEEIMRTESVDPSVQKHVDELSQAEGIVIVHPNWWGMPPAIMKGWIDRTFRPGCAYAFEEVEGGIGQPIGLLKAATVVIFNTENTPKEIEEQYFGDPLDSLWKKNVFGICGARDIYRRMFHGVLMSTEEIRKSWLAEVEDVINRYFPAVGQEMAA